ncbi:MAG: tetrahydromethanopterin S-methyltransferase subunit C [Methanobrevibacter sp.]|nr:tetrahydromethanopterin S-methyltransferase subunit C [Methanobrevibacter sp.]
MSAAGGGPAGSAIKPEILLILGVVGGLVGLYLVGINPIFGPLLAALGGVCAIIWGADAIRRVASYGLGTGVPSIGYMCLAIGIIGGLAGLALASGSLLSGLEILAPVFALVFAMVLGLIIALIVKLLKIMKIAVLERCTAEIAGAAGLSVVCFSAAVAGSYEFVHILALVVATGIIAVFFIMNCMAIQHPFNACLGPNENQVRTLKLAAATGFLSMIVTAFMTVINPQLVFAGIPAWILIFVVGLIGWLISIKLYIAQSYEEAASVKWAGLWPKVEE